jgi:hypothetical protein
LAHGAESMWLASRLRGRGFAATEYKWQFGSKTQEKRHGQAASTHASLSVLSVRISSSFVAEEEEEEWYVTIIK